MTRDQSVYIKEIWNRIQRIEEYTRDGRDAFFQSTLTQDAVIRNIEVIGQAVKDFGVDKLLAAHSDTPWEQIAGMRNILAHQYLGVDLELTWDVVARDLAPLKEKIIALANDMQIQFE